MPLKVFPSPAFLLPQVHGVVEGDVVVGNSRPDIAPESVDDHDTKDLICGALPEVVTGP
jgi:hypothetical protein